MNVARLLVASLFVGCIAVGFSQPFFNSSFSTVSAATTPRNYGEASQVGFQGIILNNHPLVLEKLKQIAKSFDQARFADNLVAVYDYVKGLPYYNDGDVYGAGEYWATAPEMIQTRGGDCEDHAILLATLIETLYKETYGTIPQNLVWVLAGRVKIGSELAGHSWTIINLSAISSDASSRLRSIPAFRTKIEAVIGDIIRYKGETIREKWVRLDLAQLAPKQKRFALSIFWVGDEYVELESTWGSAISEYYDKAYPYTEVWVAFNSLQYVDSPKFVPSGRPPLGTAAVIKNVAFNREVKVNEASSIRVTVQNFGRGILGADFILIVRSSDREIGRDSAYIPKYIWTIHSFSFNLVSTSPGAKFLRLELCWNNQGSLQLEDSTEFRFLVVDGSTPTTSATQTSARSTMRSLWLSSTTWRHGDTVTWSAEGLTPNGIVSTRIEGSWGGVDFPDVRADSNGDAGVSFTVGTNIGGSGRFVVIDRSTNIFLTKDYTLAQAATTTKPITVALEIGEAYWTVGGARVTQAKLGQVVQARIAVRAIGESVDVNVVMKVRKDKVAWPDSDHATASFRIQLGKDQSAELVLSFVADQKSDFTFRGFFMQIEFVSWGSSWTMPDGYPPRLRVV